MPKLPSLAVVGSALLFACSGPTDRSPSSSPLRPSIVGSGAGSGRVSASLSCTFTQGFWKTHADAWPVTELVLGGVTYTEAAALSILGTPPRGDATEILAHQLIAARLNVLNGADPTAVASTLDDADAYLAANPLGSKPSGPTRDTGIALAGVLDSYNNGSIGPGHCGDILPSPPPSPSPSPTSPPA